jgi:hypothetical protein
LLEIELGAARESFRESNHLPARPMEKNNELRTELSREGF